MSFSSLVGLANNAAFLLALSLLYDIIGVRPVGQKSGLRQLLTGVVIGAIGIAIMSNPWDFGHGVVFDTRSVLLCVAGLFFGTVSTVLAVVMTAAYRLSIGGAGACVGVAVIVTSGAIGLAWRHFRSRIDLQFSMGELYLMGIIAHLAMLAWMLMLPWNVAVSVLKAISLPVMLIHPLTTALLGMLLAKRGRRHEAEYKLRASEEKYRRLAENISDVVWIVDLDLRTTYVSPSVERLVGESAEAHLQRTMEEKFPPDSLEKLAAVFAEEMEREKDPECDPNRSRMLEVEHYRADGSTLWVSINTSFVRDKDGKPVAIQGGTRDITEVKLAEKRRMESRELLENLARLVPGVIYQYRLYPDGTSAFPYSSPGMYDIYGVTPEEVREDASVIFGRLHPDDHDRVAEAIFESARTLNTFHCELRVILPEKGLGWRWSQAHPERTEDGGTLWHGIILDVTELKQAEQALREQEERLRAIFESTQDAVYLKDTKLCYTHCNLAMASMFGLNREEIIGQTDVELFQADNAEEIAVKDRQVLAEGRPQQGTFTRVIRGAKRIINTSKAPVFDVNGNVVGLCGMSRDITEEVNLRDQMRQAQKMESVGRLAGGVAHDYNNMLSVILGYSEMLLETIDSSDANHSAVVEIQGAARRSADITRQLLAFARQQTIEPEVLDLNDTVGGMLTMLHRLIGEDIDLAWMPGAALWSVKMDPSQIDQILANLCVNASDAINGVGKVTIETENAVFDAAYCNEHPGAMEGEYVLLAVSDDGCGMDAETLQKIFEPFFTTKPDGKGTGLGLATTYGIVKQNEGFINVYSEPDKGTTFRIYLPRDASEASENRVDAALEPPRSCGETILLVEDEAPILNLGKQMLQSLGYDVIISSSPVDALEMAERHECRIDMLITDVVMPAMSGRDLSDRLVKLYPKLKTLYMSGYTANVIAHRGVLDEGVQFIAKPFSKIDLAFKLRGVLDNDEE